MRAQYKTLAEQGNTNRVVSPFVTVGQRNSSVPIDASTNSLTDSSFLHSAKRRGVAGDIVGNGFPISVQSGEAHRHRICLTIRLYMRLSLGGIEVIHVSSRRLIFVLFGPTFPRYPFISKLMEATCSMKLDPEIGIC